MSDRPIDCIPLLLARAKAMGLDDEVAEEVVARSLTWAIDNVDKFEQGSDLRDWLLLILYTQAMRETHDIPRASMLN